MNTDAPRLLGQFIRAHRERLTPPARAFGRRRTPGWRREELADAAGVSVTWVTFLEQGRQVSASAAALVRLAEALQLSLAERATLFELAAKRDPEQPDAPAKAVSDELLALPKVMAMPAYLLDRCWYMQAWNSGAEALFKGWLDNGEAGHNLLAFVFLTPLARQLIADWPVRAERLVAEFRSDFSRHPGDSQLQALVDDLMAKSLDFSQCWQAQSVQYREGGERLFNTANGRQRFIQNTLIPAAQPDCKLVCLMPVPGA
ncbi:helix-turn-helix domain-containing protein [Gallaecimonas mangrovi]|uniref:helix-turn-helix domain-containing protein n=1 Tax=Gallaecimonas mangrovi TaxID=2291597 RepID=UPI000E20B5E2|nr:helix-turn-helix transcriptional regulator [Gallaecimonas mangrovi]